MTTIMMTVSAVPAALTGTPAGTASCGHPETGRSPVSSTGNLTPPAAPLRRPVTTEAGRLLLTEAALRGGGNVDNLRLLRTTRAQGGLHLLQRRKTGR